MLPLPPTPFLLQQGLLTLAVPQQCLLAKITPPCFHCGQGKHLALLPVEPQIGKALVFGCMLGCLDPVLTIAALLSQRNPFVMPMSKKEQADLAKRRFAQVGCSLFRRDAAAGQTYRTTFFPFPIPYTRFLASFLGGGVISGTTTTYLFVMLCMKWNLQNVACLPLFLRVPILLSSSLLAL